MRVGRGLRFYQLQASKNPSSILIHSPALPAGNASRLKDFLKAVGHKANTFDDVNRLNETLKTGQYDLVLTNLSAAPDLERQVASLSPKTVVVPVTFKQLKSEEAVVARQFKVIVKNPKYAEDFLQAVNQVMKSRSKKV
ncbi:MAG TPA: hypothetical protein VMM84_09560 [Pyrinomonadaceae bacterium]|nr:hypothetical protein [Pyrinomonadaceae bacterium]